MKASIGEILEQAILSTGAGIEMCGLLGGHLKNSSMALATTVKPLTNLSLRKDSFAVDVEEFCQKRDEIEREGLIPLALYHSHSHGSTRPSFRDRRLPWITDLPSLILAWHGYTLRFECYHTIDGKTVTIRVVA